MGGGGQNFVVETTGRDLASTNSKKIMAERRYLAATPDQLISDWLDKKVQ